ncbi:MAG: tetratricopeptide repeat protein [Pseudanabaenaceae cyanobacterium bins.68]|nr:tetratricopeptide repeat protein [Pseudanabaenaceae cyanobacterium bins.68]
MKLGFHNSWPWAILLTVARAAVVGCLVIEPQPLYSQSLIPHTLNLDFSNLEKQGLSLARDAAQLAQFQQYDLALSRARLAVELSPQAYQTQAVLGSIYLRTEKYAEAIAALTKANELKADNPGVLFALGAAYLRQGKFEPAVQTLKQGLALSPKENTAIFDLGNAYFQLKRYDMAIAEYQKILAADQTFWAATNNIGLIEYERGNTSLAMQQWQKAVDVATSLEDRGVAEPKLAIAVVTYRQGNQAQGLQLGKESLNADPRYGKLEFLKENLWGDKLLGEARQVLQDPVLREIVEASVQVNARPRRR